MSNETTLSQNGMTSEETTQNIWQRVADFIVKAEFSRQQTSEYTSARSVPAEKARNIDHHINLIRQEIRDFKSIMTRAGAMQWRNESERLVEEGQKELQGISQSYRELKSAITEQCESLNRSSMNTVKNVSQLVSSVKHTNIKRMNDEKAEELSLTCETSLNQVDRIVQMFHWKNMILVVLLSILVSTIVSLYIDDGWPWQVHAEVAKERQAGKILMNSWSQLNPNDQLTIENA